jgi:hypothetical protein
MEIEDVVFEISKGVTAACLHDLDVKVILPFAVVGLIV